LQNLLLKYSSRYIDAFIFSSHTMKDYFNNFIVQIKEGSYLIIPPALSRAELPREYLPPITNTPNLVFLGRPDWWLGQPTDNMNKFIDAAIFCGLHVYYAGHIDEEITSDGNRHIFKSMKLDRLANFVTQFDASLIMYNLDNASRHERFNNTIPDRLIASVAFGIPIAIPKKGYEASKEFLREYEAVIEFESFYELKSILDDRGRVAILKQQARANSKHYFLEKYIDKLIEFIANFTQS